ncbi:MAG: tyrosine-type recombinase/integrase [Candidatus Bathyarchaeota archaeon]|nr:tyrosine-type recombinase/integrase [Candidatus Bathyarchaeota archaeon]
MKLSVQEFLDSVQNPNTKKGYRHGIKKFCEWYGKSAEEILEMRKDDLTQRAGENLIEYKNRAARFGKEIENFHSYLLSQGYSTNSSRNLTIGIRQLFRFYQMPVRIRAGSKVTKTVKTSKSFPLRIEHVRKMFAVADLRERVILSMATDLGLRISDFMKLKKDDLSPLNQEPPIPFDLTTGKEEIIAHGFLSQETADLLRAYLPTLERKNGNPYLFPSNGKSHISDEWLNRLLQRLAEKSKIAMNGKSLTFHCFRKMLLSAAIDSGIGLTAGKKLCGKAIPQSDDTYLTTVNLQKKFTQLKRFQTIKEQPRVETEKIESLKSAVNKLQEELTRQRLITDTISEENIRTKQELERLQPLVEFVNSFDAPENLKTILNYLKEDYMDAYSDERLRPLKVEISPYISKKLEEIAKKMGITQKEALAELVKEDLETMENAEKKFKKLEERIKSQRRRKPRT